MKELLVSPCRFMIFIASQDYLSFYVLLGVCFLVQETNNWVFFLANILILFLNVYSHTGIIIAGVHIYTSLCHFDLHFVYSSVFLFFPHFCGFCLNKSNFQNHFSTLIRKFRLHFHPFGVYLQILGDRYNYSPFITNATVIELFFLFLTMINNLAYFHIQLKAFKDLLLYFKHKMFHFMYFSIYCHLKTFIFKFLR